MKVGLRRRARLSSYAGLSAATLAMLYGASRAAADVLVYDPQQTGSPQGSSGDGNPWDSSTPIWYSQTSGTDVTFNPTTPDSVIFGGYNAAGGLSNVVLLNETLNVQNITFNTSNDGVTTWAIVDGGNNSTLNLFGNITKASGNGQPGFQLYAMNLSTGSHVFAINDSPGDTNPELRFQNSLSGPGKVVINNGIYSQYGTTQFVVDNTYLGGTDIIKGRLEILSGGALGSGLTTISNQGNLALGGSGTAFSGGTTIANAITITRNTYAGADYNDYPDAITANNVATPQSFTITNLTVDSTDARIAANSNTILLPNNILQGSDVPTSGVLTLDGDYAGYVTLGGDNSALKGGIALIGGVELNVSTELNLAGAGSSLNLSGGTVHPTGALLTDGFMNDFGSAALGFGGHIINNGTGPTALGTLNTGVDIDPGQAFNASSLYGVSLGSRGTGTLNFIGNNVFSGVPFYDAGTVNIVASGNTSMGSFRLRNSTLNIQSGATLTTTNSYADIGVDGTNSGVLNVLSGGRLALSNNDFNVSDNAGTTGVLNLSGTAVVTNLGTSYVGKSSGASGTLSMNGSSSFVSNGSLVIGRGGSTGNATVGGTAILTANGSSTSPNYGIGVGITGGTGTLTLNGGTVNANANVAGSFALGNANGAAANTFGTLIMTAGALNVAGETWVGSTDNSTNSITDAGQGHAYGTVQMSGGTITGNSWMAIGRFGSQGIFNLSGGQVIKQGGNNAYVGETNPNVTSSLNITGTGFWNSSTGEFWVGQGGGVGVLNVSGSGSFVGNSWLAIGRQGGFGTVNLSGGSITQQGSNHLTLGSGGASTGIVNVTGGTLTALNAYIGEADTGVGVLNISGTGAVVLNGTTTLGNAATATGTVNLNGGTLTAAQIVHGGSTGTQTFNFNGGQLIASAASTNFLSGMNVANVLQGGAILNSSSYSIGVGQNLSAGVGSTGGLTKLGTGTLTLSGSNTYAGATNITGTLVSGSAKSIPGGAPLVVAASSGVNFNGFYPQAVNVSTGVLSLASLTAGGGDLFGFNASSAGIDGINFSSASTVTGTNTINLNVPAGTPLSNGTYYLFSDAAGGLGNAFNFNLNNAPVSGTSANISTGGYIYKLTFNSSNTADTVLVAQQAIAKLYYSGVNGTDMNTAGNYALDAAGTLAAPSGPNSTVDVVFTTATPTNLTPVANTAVALNSMEFNSSAGVAISGPGTISITAGLNTFNAGTGIVVDAGAGASSIAAPLNLYGNQQFVNNSTNPLTLSGSIGFNAGSGTLTYAGNGTGGSFVVGGANNYAGSTNVSAGAAVQLSSGSALGNAANRLNLVGGTLDLFGQNVSQASLYMSGGRLLGTTGNGVLTLTANGSNPSIVFNYNYQYPRAAGDITAPLSLPAGGSIVKTLNNVGGQPVITGNILLNGATTIALADTGNDFAAELTLTGTVSGATGSITVNNQATFNGVTLQDTSDYGTLLLSGSNSYGGGTNIVAGKIVVTNGAALGTGPVTITQRSGGGGGVLALGDSNYTSANSPLAPGAIATGITITNPINFGGQISGVYGYGIYNDSGNNTLSGPITLTNASQSIFVNAGSITVSNVIGESFTGAGLVKRSTGTLYLTGTANTYTGLTQFNSGVTVINSLANGSSPSSIGASTAAPANLVFSGGTLQYNGSNVTTNRGYTVAASGTFNTTSAVTFGGQILATGGTFTKLGSGTVAYTNTAGLNTFETATGYGSFLVSQGTVVLGAPGVTASGQTNSIPGELDISGTGALGYAEFDINGGTTNVGGYVTTSRGNSTTNLTSTLNVGGDAAFNVNNASFGYSNGLGSYNASGTVNLSGTAVWKDSNVFRVAESNGSNIVVNMGGTTSLTVNGASGTGGLQVGYQGIGTFNQAGGTVVATNNPVQIGSGGATGAGTYLLGNGSAGALLRTGSVAGGSGTSTFVFNGGTLQANGSSTTFVSALTHAYIAAGPAVIDTNSYAATIPQALATSPSVTTDAGLTKIGAGTLTLTGSNTYNGPTMVNVGTLATGATGNFGAGNVTVAANATLLLSNNTSIADTATLSFYDASAINLSGGSGTTETISVLTNLGTSVSYNTGVYTASQLNSMFSDSAFFSPNGETLTLVGAPEPTSVLLLGGAVAPLILGRRRRRAKALVA